MMRIGTLLGALIACASLAQGVNQTTFGTSAPGYLYNVGSQVFLTWAKTPAERFMWIQGKRNPLEAKLFRIQRASYHSATYNLIMPADPNLNNMFKQKVNPIPAYPFHGMPAMCLLGTRFNKYIGLTLDTSNSNAWFSFSPPITRENYFQIYLNDKCLEIENEGYLNMHSCVLYPNDKRRRQLFRWLSEDEYLVYQRHYMENDKVVKVNPVILPKGYTPIEDAPKRQKIKEPAEVDYELMKKLHSHRIADLPKKYYDNPESSDSEETMPYRTEQPKIPAQKIAQMPPGF